MIRGRWVLICVLAALAAGCGGQQQPPAPSPQRSSSSTISRGGCTIDLRKVCQAFIDQPHFVYHSVEYDWRSFSQDNPPHAEIQLPLNLANGEYLGTVNCHVTTESRKATDAELMHGPPVSDKAVEYIKGKGWCEEDSPDYGKLMSEITRKIAPE
ncbi:MAG: hypothetical protein LAN18_16790 [Acidobacteriia bacterium]|nr:hypothetical protein [Terriglobia bacterium]